MDDEDLPRATVFPDTDEIIEEVQSSRNISMRERR